MLENGPVCQERLSYRPALPHFFHDLSKVALKAGEFPNVRNEISHLFPRFAQQPVLEAIRGKTQVVEPLKVGVLFSGGPAPGGHNVITALFSGIKQLHHQSRLWGFLSGPAGLVAGNYKELTADVLALYQNQGGFDLIGSGRLKLESKKYLSQALHSIQLLQLDALVIIGGDDSNTTAAILAHYCAEQQNSVAIIGVPKTIDGDIQNRWVPISFGFDTATKVYAETIGNICIDARSAGKYYHFIKLMGRNASHIALECALKSRPNFTLIGEQQKSLAAIVAELANLVENRYAAGKHYGVVLIPEGLVDFMPEMRNLFKALGALQPHELPDIERATWSLIPKQIQDQLLLERDSYGNIPLSAIETEKLLIEMTKQELAKRAFAGKFQAVPHFLGYEGRCALPSNFDVNYCTMLGYTAALLAASKASGYLCFVDNLDKPIQEWRSGGVPLTALITIEERAGTATPVIGKALVDIHSKRFLHFVEQSHKWSVEDCYRQVGPMQFFGHHTLVDSIPEILKNGLTPS